MQQKKQMKLLLYKRNVHFYHVIILYCTYEYLCIIFQNEIFVSFYKKITKFGKKNIDLSDLASLPSDRNASGNLMYKFDWLKEKGGEKTTGKEIAQFLLAHDSLTLDQKVILTRLLNQYFSLASLNFLLFVL